MKRLKWQKRIPLKKELFNILDNDPFIHMYYDKIVYDETVVKITKLIANNYRRRKK